MTAAVASVVEPTLDNARLQYARALAAFRLAVNLPADAEVDVVIPTVVPVINPDTAVAVQQALRAVN